MLDKPQFSLSYRIDEYNRIVWVNEAWSQFARDNGGESLLPDRVLGQDLLQSLSDPAVRELYISMIRRARTGRVVQFHYRCDAPEARRMFLMQIQSCGDGLVEFTSTLSWEQPRPAIALLDAAARRDASQWISMCSWCQAVALPDRRWVEVEVAVAEMHLLERDALPVISHGICPACHDRVVSALGLG